MRRNDSEQRSFFKARCELWVCLVLVVCALAVYGPVRHFEFIAYDDGLYVAENARVQEGLTRESIIWSFTTAAGGNWHPITWLSHMLDCRLYGMNPGRHHLTSVLFHVANTLLLFLILRRMTGGLWQSAFVAALFALHPLHVESVAWVSERKDVLSTFFGMLALGGYALYVQRPGTGKYLAVLALFAVGLLAKPMLVTLPFVLLLLDYWPLGRFQLVAPHGLAGIMVPGKSVLNLVVEKVPFILFGAASSVVTLQVERIGSSDLYPLSARVANALVAYAAYIGKTLWPTNLACFYPYPGELPVWQSAGAALLLVIVTVAAVKNFRRRPYLFVGWFWYLGTLVPVIGLVQVGPQSMADRYTYVPLIGLFIMVAWGMPDLLRKTAYKKFILVFSSILVVSILSIVSAMQVGYWENSHSLFLRAIQSTRDNWLAHINLGAVLADGGQSEAAIHHYRRALGIQPDNAYAHSNLALLLSENQRPQEASVHFRKAVMIAPGNASFHYNYGMHLLGQEKAEPAAAQFLEAVENDPQYAEAYNILGIVTAQQGRYDRAEAFFSKALAIRPGYDDAQKNLAVLKASRSKVSQTKQD